MSARNRAIKRAALRAQLAERAAVATPGTVLVVPRELLTQDVRERSEIRRRLVVGDTAERFAPGEGVHVERVRHYLAAGNELTAPTCDSPSKQASGDVAAVARSDRRRP